MFVLAASIISVARVLKRGVKHLMSLLSLENTERGEIKRKSSLCQKSDGQVRSANFVAPCPLHFVKKSSGHGLTSRKLRQSWNRSANPCTTTAGSQPANPSCPNCAKLPIQSLHHYPAPKSLLRPTRLVLKDEATGLKLVELCQRFPTQNSAPP